MAELLDATDLKFATLRPRVSPLGLLRISAPTHYVVQFPLVPPLITELVSKMLANADRLSIWRFSPVPTPDGQVCPRPYLTPMLPRPLLVTHSTTHD